jgi:hypothetical protein
MTATIETSSRMSNNARRDPQLRRRDYEIALRFYLSLPEGAPQAILFCENSGADLTSLREIAENENPHERPVDFLSYVSDVPPEHGKSRAELDIIRRAFSDVIARQAEPPMVWKVTGRLIVWNLQQIIASRPEHAEMYCDTRSVRALGNLVGANFWVDTRLIGFSPHYFQKYIGGISDIRKNAIECAVYDAIYEHLEADKAIAPRFKHQPLIHGVCAGSNEDYESRSYRMKTAVRQIARKIAPGVWI